MTEDINHSVNFTDFEVIEELHKKLSFAFCFTECLVLIIFVAKVF